MEHKQIIEADWTWTGERFESDVQVVISSDGAIDHVGNVDVRPTHRLRDRALLPGFVNTHSHAFQRGLRGHGERFPQGQGSFWAWRQAMYDLVEQMDAERLYELTVQAFREMRAAGITTVGEFHYLHHDARGEGYRLDDVILTAAMDADIRLVLLNVFYNTGGINQPLEPTQRRFASPTVDDFRRQLDKLGEKLDRRMQSLGVVAHSVRAARLDDIAALHQLARSAGLVFHMHVEEQRREIDESVHAYAKPPMALLNERLDIDDGFTAVHCTHTRPEDMQPFAAAGGNVCLCPLTEANLGDGIADVPGILSAAGHICVGTDSNARISMTEELRWLEYVQRLRHEARGIAADHDGQVGRAMLNMATTNGARALGLPVGRIEAGAAADFVTIDLASPSLVGWTPDTLLDAFLLGTGNEAIANTCVAGRWGGPIEEPAR